MKRLPIYILVDTSGSMEGEKIEKVKSGLEGMKRVLSTTIETQDSTFVSLILFNSSAEIAVKLTPIRGFQIPNLTAGGMTSYADALSTLVACYNTDVVKRTASNQGSADYKPILLMFSDGAPTDSSSTLRAAIEDFQTNHARKFGACVCFYAHSSSDSESEIAKTRSCLEQICGKSQNGDRVSGATLGTLIDVSDDYNKIKEFFKAFSQSIVSSQKASKDPAQGLNADLKQELGDDIQGGMVFS